MADAGELYRRADEAFNGFDKYFIWAMLTGVGAGAVLIGFMESQVVQSLNQTGRGIFLLSGLLALVLAWICGGLSLAAMQYSREHNEAKEKLEHELGQCCCGE